MPTIDEDLSQIEKDIRSLKIEYEQYFGGGKKRPPADTEWRIETLIKRYGDRGGQMNFAQRFRYSNLTQTYAKYKEIFRKRLRLKEEGGVQRHFGAAAKAIEAERARKAASGATLPFTVSWTDPDREKKKVEELYQAFRHAKELAGEDTHKFTPEAFQKFVKKKTEELKKQQHAHEVEYVVEIEGKHAHLKARVKS